MSPVHFFFEMRLSEAAAYLRGMERREREAWERARWVVYSNLAPWSKEVTEPADVGKFPWEKEEAAPIDEEELKRLRERARKMSI